MAGDAGAPAAEMTRDAPPVRKKPINQAFHGVRPGGSTSANNGDRACTFANAASSKRVSRQDILCAVSPAPRLVCEPVKTVLRPDSRVDIAGAT